MADPRTPENQPHAADIDQESKLVEKLEQQARGDRDAKPEEERADAQDEADTES